MIDFIKKYAYSCCLIWLLCVGILTNINLHYDLEVHEVFVVFIALLWAIVIQLFDKNKKNAIPYLVIGFVLMIIVIVLITTKISLSEEIGQYWIWINSTIIEMTSKNLWYSMFTVVLLSLCLLLILHMLIRQYKLRLAIAILLLGSLIVVSIFKVEVSKIGISAFLTYIILCIVEAGLTAWNLKQGKESAKAMPFLLPFLFVVLVFLAFLPISEKPIEWKLVKQFIGKISDSIDSLVTNIDYWLHPEKEEFSLVFTGYSEDGEIGGTLSDSNSEAIRIKTHSSITNNMYLTGNTKNYFDGSKWSMTIKEEENQYGMQEYLLDYGELLYAVERFETTGNIKDLYNVRSITIIYRDIHTKSLFYALKCRDIKVANPTNYYQSQTANIRFNDTKAKNTAYEIEYVNLNYGSALFDDFVLQQERYRYKVEHTEEEKLFLSRMEDHLLLDNKELLSDFEAILYARSQHIKRDYTQVYEGLPKRVALLAEEITGNCTSDYERLLALEDYISTYTYTTTPMEVPEGEDLIDYLLFTSKEGYCTYYATAFAIMARCLNIPTRFVQGFCIDTVSQENRYEYVAYNRDAHAWVEAYIEGVGWIPFEPTPSYSTQRYQPWTTLDEHISVTPTSYITRPSIDLEEFILEQQEQEENKKAVYQGVMVIALIIALIITITIPVYFIIRIWLVRRQYRRCAPKEKLYYDIYQILQILECCNRCLQDGETFTQYMKYTGTEYPDMSSVMNRLENIFIRIAYNDELPAEQDQQLVLEIKEQLLERVKKCTTHKKYLKLRYQMLFQNWFAMNKE